jgi:hypothetical protein
MNNEYCPSCKSLNPTNSNTTESIEVDGEGSQWKVKTTSYSCNSCQCFLHSEDERTKM